MEKRKRVIVPIEFYEDELEDFLGTIYHLKKNLTDDVIERKRKIKLSKDEYLQWMIGNLKIDYPSYRTDSPNDYKDGEKGYKIYHEEIKPYLKFIRRLAEQFYVRTLESDEDNIARGVPLPVTERFHTEEYKAHPDWETIFNFINQGHKIKELLSVKRIEKLCCYVIYAQDIYKPTVEITDIYWECASNGSNKIELPPRLQYLQLGDSMFGFRRDFNTIYSNKSNTDKWSREDKYWLAYRIYDRARYLFGELYMREKNNTNDYQLKIITGYILSSFSFKGHSIMTEDEHYNRKRSTKINSYRHYLGKVAGAWIEKGRKMAPDYWEEEIFHAPIE